MKPNSFISGRTYYDAINFPHGFGRSGHFSIREATMLSECGHIARALMLGECEPSNSEQVSFVMALQGKKIPEQDIEKLWLKYQSTITSNKTRFSCLGSHSSVANNHNESI